MKLDKRACRHAANVPLHISLNAGVLYTERVKYLVTAAVKLLGGHRVLAVYFYECERLKANDRMPKWVVFQGKDDFVTLERDAEGNVKWRDRAHPLDVLLRCPRQRRHRDPRRRLHAA